MEQKKVKFHLPGFTVNAKFNLVFLNMYRNMPQFFRDNVEIASFYDAFSPAMWNGGRTIGGYLCDETFVKNILSAFNSKGIPLRFTFTNPVLEEKHLHDEFCNKIMKLADNGLNEVIVASPLLEEYIRDKYPNYKITSSTCKRITDETELHAELERDYHVVVLDYDLNNKFEILEKLPHKEKCEFLINSCCVPKCASRSEEYRLVGLQQIAYCEHLKKHPDKPFRMSDYSDVTVKKNIKCPSGGNNIFDSKKCSHHLSPDAIWNTYVPMGFQHFKIEGRTAGKLFLLENYMYYLIKPECRDEARFLFLHNLERNGLIKIDG
ncbi:MAG: hypothetical protein E7501_07345 [Ruminococcus sp.]|nr:hypothetical protein [Ruminococcus sp.]MBQ8905812.1 hypothetical protein [Ruminococcus sp.]